MSRSYGSKIKNSVKINHPSSHKTNEKPEKLTAGLLEAWSSFGDVKSKLDNVEERAYGAVLVEERTKPKRHTSKSASAKQTRGSRKGNKGSPPDKLARILQERQISAGGGGGIGWKGTQEQQEDLSAITVEGNVLNCSGSGLNDTFTVSPERKQPQGLAHVDSENATFLNEESIAGHVGNHRVQPLPPHSSNESPLLGFESPVNAGAIFGGPVSFHRPVRKVHQETGPVPTVQTKESSKSSSSHLKSSSQHSPNSVSDRQHSRPVYINEATTSHRHKPIEEEGASRKRPKFAASHHPLQDCDPSHNPSRPSSNPRHRDTVDPIQHQHHNHHHHHHRQHQGYASQQQLHHQPSQQQHADFHPPPSSSHQQDPLREFALPAQVALSSLQARADRQQEAVRRTAAVVNSLLQQPPIIGPTVPPGSTAGAVVDSGGRSSSSTCDTVPDSPPARRVVRKVYRSPWQQQQSSTDASSVRLHPAHTDPLVAYSRHLGANPVLYDLSGVTAGGGAWDHPRPAVPTARSAGGGGSGVEDVAPEVRKRKIANAPPPRRAVGLDGMRGLSTAAKPSSSSVGLQPCYQAPPNASRPVPPRKTTSLGKKVQTATNPTLRPAEPYATAKPKRVPASSNTVTPFSWREGREITKRVEAAMMEKDQPKRQTKTPSTEVNELRSLAGSTASTTVGTVGHVSVSSDQPKAPAAFEVYLPDFRTTDMDEMLVDLESSPNRPLGQAERHSPSPPEKRKLKKPPASAAKKLKIAKDSCYEVPKRRHYDPADIRQYIQKQKEERRIKEQERHESSKRSQELKKQRLKELADIQHNQLTSNLARTYSRRQHQPPPPAPPHPAPLSPPLHTYGGGSGDSDPYGSASQFGSSRCLDWEHVHRHPASGQQGRGSHGNHHPYHQAAASYRSDAAGHTYTRSSPSRSPHKYPERGYHSVHVGEPNLAYTDDTPAGYFSGGCSPGLKPPSATQTSVPPHSPERQLLTAGLPATSSFSDPSLSPASRKKKERIQALLLSAQALTARIVQEREKALTLVDHGLPSSTVSPRQFNPATVPPSVYIHSSQSVSAAAVTTTTVDSDAAAGQNRSLYNTTTTTSSYRSPTARPPSQRLPSHPSSSPPANPQPSPAALPGVANLRQHARAQHRLEAEAGAATVIQAAYRGWAVRKYLSGVGVWPLQKESLRRHFVTAAGVTFSNGRKSPNATPVRRKATQHGGASRRQAARSPSNKAGMLETHSNVPVVTPSSPYPRHEGVQSAAARLPESAHGTSELKELRPWEKRGGDKHSIVNIYSRKCLKASKHIQPMLTLSTPKENEPAPQQPVSYGDSEFESLTPTDDLSVEEQEQVNQELSLSGERTPDDEDHLERFSEMKSTETSSSTERHPSFVGVSTSSHTEATPITAVSQHTSASRPLYSENFESVASSLPDHTAGGSGADHRQSIEPDSLTEDASVFAPSPSKSLTPLGRGRSTKSSRTVPKSETAASQDEEGTVFSHGQAFGPAEMQAELVDPSRSTGGGHLSPGTLEARLQTELQRLEVANQQIHRVSEVERAQARQMGQQEALSLTHALKNAHELEMKKLSEKTQADLDNLKRQMTSVHTEASRAAQRVGQLEREAREKASLHQQYTMKLEEEARQSQQRLAEVRREASEAVIESAKRQLENAHSLATETAVSAARAAVEAILLKQAHRRGEDRRRLTGGTPGYEYSSASGFEDVTTTETSRDTTATSTAATSTAAARTDEESELGSRSADHVSTEAAAISIQDEIETSVSGDDSSVRTLTEAGESPEDLNSTLKADEGEEVVEEEEEESTEGGDEISSEVVDQTQTLSQTHPHSSFDLATDDDDDDDKAVFWKVLPSESHRRRQRRGRASSRLSLSSVASDRTTSSTSTMPEDPASMGRLGPGRGSPGQGPDLDRSFDNFTLKVFNQFVKDQEIRAKHQRALLKLKEKALEEQTRAKMKALENMKKHLEKKGSDERMPDIQKKQEVLLRKYKNERAELHNLQEAERTEREHRKLLLLQHQEIGKLKLSTQIYLKKAKRLEEGDDNVSLSVSSLSPTATTFSGESPLTTPRLAPRSVSTPTSFGRLAMATAPTPLGPAAPGDRDLAEDEVFTSFETSSQRTPSSQTQPQSSDVSRSVQSDLSSSATTTGDASTVKTAWSQSSQQQQQQQELSPLDSVQSEVTTPTDHGSASLSTVQSEVSTPGSAPRTSPEQEQGSALSPRTTGRDVSSSLRQSSAPGTGTGLASTGRDATLHSPSPTTEDASIMQRLQQLESHSLSERKLAEREERLARNRQLAEKALQSQENLLERERRLKFNEAELSLLLDEAKSTRHKRLEVMTARVSDQPETLRRVAKPSRSGGGESAFTVAPSSTQQSVTLTPSSLHTTVSTAGVTEELSSIPLEGSVATESPSEVEVTSVRYGQDTFESAATVTGVLTSTPRQLPRLSAPASHSHREDNSPASTDVTTISSSTAESVEIELRIRRLRDDVKRKKGEVRRAQQEQKRKKRAALQEKEDQLKIRLQALDQKLQGAKHSFSRVVPSTALLHSATTTASEGEDDTGRAGERGRARRDRGSKRGEAEEDKIHTLSDDTLKAVDDVGSEVVEEGLKSSQQSGGSATTLSSVPSEKKEDSSLHVAEDPHSQPSYTPFDTEIPTSIQDDLSTAPLPEEQSTLVTVPEMEDRSAYPAPHSPLRADSVPELSNRDRVVSESRAAATSVVLTEVGTLESSVSLQSLLSQGVNSSLEDASSSLRSVPSVPIGAGGAVGAPGRVGKTSPRAGHHRQPTATDRDEHVSTATSETATSPVATAAGVSQQSSAGHVVSSSRSAKGVSQSSGSPSRIPVRTHSLVSPPSPRSSRRDVGSKATGSKSQQGDARVDDREDTLKDISNYSDTFTDAVRTHSSPAGTTPRSARQPRGSSAAETGDLKESAGEETGEEILTDLDESATSEVPTSPKVDAAALGTVLEEQSLPSVVVPSTAVTSSELHKPEVHKQEVHKPEVYEQEIGVPEVPVCKPEVIVQNDPIQVELGQELGGRETPEATDVTSQLAQSFQVGQRVLVGNAVTGAIMFIGQVHFAPGTYVGVQLDLPRGQHDGSISGRQYFDCPENCGIFAPPSKVSVLEEGDEERTGVLGHTSSEEDENDRALVGRDSQTPDELRFSVAHSEERDRERSRSATPSDVESATPSEISTESEVQVMSPLMDDDGILPQSPDLVYHPARVPVPSSVRAEDVIRSRVSAAKPCTNKVNGVAEGLMNQMMNELIADIATAKRKKSPPQSQAEADERNKVLADSIANELLSLYLQSEIHLLCNLRGAKLSAAVEEEQSSRFSPQKALEDSRPSHLVLPSPRSTEAQGSLVVAGVPHSTVVHPHRLSPEPPSPPSPPLSPPGSPPRYSGRALAGDRSPPSSSPDAPLVHTTAAASAQLRRAVSTESLTSLVREHQFSRAELSLLPRDRESVDQVTSRAWNDYHNAIDFGLPVDQMQTPEDVLLIKPSVQQPPPQHPATTTGLAAQDQRVCREAFLHLVYRLALDLMQDALVNAGGKRDSPTARRSHSAPTGRPSHRAGISLEAPRYLEDIQQQVFTRLIEGRLSIRLPKGRYHHSNRRPGGREVDFLEALLIKELRAEGRSWTEFEKDEHQIKIKTADNILSSLIADTVSEVQRVHNKKMHVPVM